MASSIVNQKFFELFAGVFLMGLAWLYFRVFGINKYSVYFGIFIAFVGFCALLYWVIDSLNR